MKHLLLLYMLVMSLGSCASMSAVSAVSGSAVNGVLYIFQGEELSLPLGLRATLVSVQKGLRSLGLEVDILEEKEGEYFIQFNNKKLRGTMQLNRETLKLTTVFVRIRDGVVRNKSVEKAVLQAIEKAALRVSNRNRFSYQGYLYVYEKSDVKSKKVAWFRRGAMAKYSEVMSDSTWLQLKLPSNKKGFIKSRTAKIKRK